MIHTYNIEQDFGIEQIAKGDIIHPTESYLVENHDQGVYLECYVQQATSPGFSPARTADSILLESMIVA